MEFLINLSEGSQFAIQLAIVLICLFYGAKKGGIALGLLGGVGLIVLVFGFGIEPGKPAIDVMLTILAVVVTSATLQASGGLDVNCGKITTQKPEICQYSRTVRHLYPHHSLRYRPCGLYHVADYL